MHEKIFLIKIYDKEINILCFLIYFFKFSSRNLRFHLIFLKNEAIYATLHPFTSNVGCNVSQNIVLTYITI